MLLERTHPHGLPCSLIAVEGCVGSGKTTIAQGLATRRGSRALLEDFSAVPFLSAFYETPARFALETEFAFLLQHYHQLHLGAEGGGEIIADFTLSKDLMFAELNMSDPEERHVFSSLHRLLSKRVPTVALTLFLSASDALIADRIKRRGREFETAVDFDYFRRVNHAYERYFSGFEGPLIRIRADDMDFCQNPELFQWLSSQVEKEMATV